MIVPMPGDIITQQEAEELAEILGCDQRDVCRACGKKVTIQIFRGEGHCCENCRKKRARERPSEPGPAVPG